MAQATFTAPNTTGAVVSVERITPEAAKRYLDLNIACNRKISESSIDRLAAQMRADEWKLSTDAIGFDVDGYLINGQHRMSAVIKTGMPQEFVVVRNLPTKNTKVLDIGRRRMIHDRLAIDGVNMTDKECCTLRIAMGDYTSDTLGTNRFNDLRSDGLVKETWYQHEDLIRFLGIRYRSKLPTTFQAVGVKAYAWLINYPSAWQTIQMKGLVAEGQTRLGRIIQFLDIMTWGYCKAYPLTELDVAAVSCNKLLTDYRARGKRFGLPQHFRVANSYMRSFLYGQPKKMAKPHTTDPFVKGIHLLPHGTQEAFAEDFCNERLIGVAA